GQKTDVVVHGQHLAVVTADESQWPKGVRWSVHPHLAASLQQRLPECPTRLAETAHPVADDMHADTGPCAFHQRITESAPDVVVADQIVFQQDSLARLADGLQPLLEVDPRIDQQLYAIAAQ